MDMNLYLLLNAHWAVGFSIAYKCPKNVRLILADGCEVPCTCRWSGLDDDGHLIWTAIPESRRSLRISDLRGVLAEDIWAGVGLELNIDVGDEHDVNG